MIYDTAIEKVLNVIGPGSCFGDWGVVNCKPSGASYITTSDAELLVIDPPRDRAPRNLSQIFLGLQITFLRPDSREQVTDDFNFKATVDQSLLMELAELTIEDEALLESSIDRGGKTIDAEMRKRQHERSVKLAKEQKMLNSFRLISRGEKREAGTRISRDFPSESGAELATVHES